MESPGVNQVEMMKLFSAQVDMMNMLTKSTTRNEELQQTILDLKRKDAQREAKMIELESKISTSGEAALQRVNEEQLLAKNHYAELTKSIEALKSNEEKISKEKALEKDLQKSIEEYRHDTMESKKETQLLSIKVDSYLTSSTLRFVEFENKVNEGIAQARNSSNTQPTQGIEGILQEVKRFENKLEKEKEDASEVHKARETRETAEKVKDKQRFEARLKEVEDNSKKDSWKQKEAVDSIHVRLHRHNDFIRNFEETVKSSLRNSNRELETKFAGLKQIVDQHAWTEKGIVKDIDNLKTHLSRIGEPQKKSHEMSGIDSASNDKYNALKAEIEQMSTSQSTQIDALRKQFVRKYDDLRIEIVRRSNEANARLQDYKTQMEIVASRDNGATSNTNENLFLKQEIEW